MNKSIDYFHDMTAERLSFEMIVTKDLTPDIYRLAALWNYEYVPVEANGSYDDEEVLIRFYPV